jgi:hypothetical protein
VNVEQEIRGLGLDFRISLSSSETPVDLPTPVEPSIAKCLTAALDIDIGDDRGILLQGADIDLIRSNRGINRAKVLG